MRPSRNRVLSYAIVGFIAFPILILNGLVQWFASGSATTLVLGLAALALAVGYVGLYLSRARIEFGDGTVRQVGALGSGRSFAVADIARVVTVDQYTFPLGSVPMLVVRGHDGRRLLRLVADWDPQALRAIADDLIARGAPHVPYPAPIAAAQLEALEPGTFRWVELHRVAFGLMLLSGVLLLMVVVVVIVLAVLLSGI